MAKQIHNNGPQGLFVIHHKNGFSAVIVFQGGASQFLPGARGQGANYLLVIVNLLAPGFNRKAEFFAIRPLSAI